MQKFYHTIVNFTPSLGRNEIINNINYMVYPVVMLVEGVHHGALGPPTYYPASVLQQNPEAWDNVAIPIYHPQDNAGNYISANSQGVESVGFIRNCAFVDGKLKAEACVNVDKANLLRPELMGELGSGSMEVSTGLFAEISEESGEWNGEVYQAVINAIVPDHLALLPNETGACSFDDGCGVRANTAVIAAVINKDGTEGYMEDTRYAELLSNKAKIQANEASFGDIERQLYGYINGLDVVRSDEGDGPYRFNYMDEIYQGSFIYREESNDGTKLYRQSYSIDNEKVTVGQERVEVYKKTEYLPVQGNNKGAVQMSKEQKPCCPEKVRALIANSNTTFTDADTEWLESMTADQLAHLEMMAQERKPEKKKSDEPVTVQSYLNDAPAEIRSVFNAGLRQLDKVRGEMIGTILANESNQFTEDELKGLAHETLERIAALAKGKEKATAPSYLGQGGRIVNVGQGTEEEPYVPNTINFGKEGK